MEALRSFISHYTPVSEADWQQIARCFEAKVFEKEEIILQEGKICRHLYFIERGLLRYFIWKDGNDVTKFFTEAPYCFTSQVSFSTEKPANESIQALEKSLVWQTTLQQANELLELKSWNTFIRKLIQEVQFYTEEILQERNPNRNCGATLCKNADPRGRFCTAYSIEIFGLLSGHCPPILE